MTVTVVAHIDINEDEPEALAEYLSLTAPVLERAGARIVDRFLLGDAIVGHRVTQSVVVVEYPSREAVLEVFRSPEYARAIPARDKAFSSNSVSICRDEGQTVVQSGARRASRARD